MTAPSSPTYSDTIVESTSSSTHSPQVFVSASASAEDVTAEDVEPLTLDPNPKATDTVGEPALLPHLEQLHESRVSTSQEEDETVSPEIRPALSSNEVQGKESLQTPEPGDGDGDDAHYPKPFVVAQVMVSVYLAIFLVALDRTIIATAIPRITDQFHALNDVGWYGSAYMLTSCAFQLTFGKLYTYYPPKWVLLSAIMFFEIGSAICATAPNSIAFIIGRAVAGVGSAGIYSGAVILIVYTVPLRRRPIYTGALGGVFGVASVGGPLLGGLFTSKVSWRWCFYINLPIGALTIAAILFVSSIPKPPLSSALGIKQKMQQLDPLGTFFFLPGVICLLLALQWGGTTYQWNNARVITLLVLFGVLMIAFAFVQAWKKETALLPLHILKQRSIASGAFYSACVGASMLLIIYYLPIWFQAIKGASAGKSGVMIIPVLLGLFVSSILAGVLTSVFGYYTPFMLIGSTIMSVGCGLLTTFTSTTDHPRWIGYQALYGIGIGFGFQQSAVGAQTVLPRKDVSTGSSLMMFTQSLGGAISVSIGSNVFTSGVVSGLAGVPNLSIGAVLNTGPTDLQSVIPPQYLKIALQAYNNGLINAFRVGLAFSCVSILGAVFMEWVSVKGPKRGNPNVEDGEEEGIRHDGEKQEGEPVPIAAVRRPPSVSGSQRPIEVDERYQMAESSYAKETNKEIDVESQDE